MRLATALHVHSLAKKVIQKEWPKASAHLLQKYAPDRSRSTDIERRSHNSYIALCNGIISLQGQSSCCLQYFTYFHVCDVGGKVMGGGRKVMGGGPALQADIPFKWVSL